MPEATMMFIEAWVLEHINPTLFRPGDHTERAQELAKWLRKDAAESGISDAEIDAAIADHIGAGHGLVNYVSDAMANVTDLADPSPEDERLADEDV